MIFITLFSAGAQRCCAIYQPQQQTVAIILSRKQFPEPNPHILTFLHSILTVQGHILSTAGDSLREELHPGHQGEPAAPTLVP
jgi:hypothetical protein